MKAYWQLTRAQLKLFSRNRQVLFFSLFFPILLMLALGSFLGNGNQVNLAGAVVDRDRTDASSGTIERLLAAKPLGLAAAEAEGEALERLRNGDLQLVVVVPEGYGAAVASGQPAEIEVYYDEQNMAASELAVQYVSSVVDGISKEMTGYVPAVRAAPKPVESLDLRYIDFLVPGIIAMMIMSSNLNGVAGQISSWRERGVLRRMQSTTLKAGTFLAGQITARLLLNGMQAVIVLLVAFLAFGTQMKGSWALALFYIVIGTLVFMSIGFIIAGLAKTPESAGPIAGLISFPLMFLGNVFFPVRNMPEWLQPIVASLPITHLSDAIRGVMNAGAGIAELWVPTAVLCAWLVGAFLVASRTFKWE